MNHKIIKTQKESFSKLFEDAISSERNSKNVLRMKERYSSSNSKILEIKYPTCANSQ